MQELIRNTIITITTVLTVLGVYVKLIDNLSIDIIKMKYKNVPGKKTKFSVVIELVGYIIISIYLVTCILIIYQVLTLIKNGSFDEIKNLFKITTTNNTNESNMISILFVWCFFISLGCTYLLILYIFPMLVRKIEINNEKNKKMINTVLVKILIYIGIITVLISIGIEVKLINKTLENSINIERINGLYIFENNISDREMKDLVFLGIITFISITSCILLNRFREIRKEIDSEDMYILVTNDKCISTRYYLEYDEYYFIYENNIENYIKKSEVKEIKRMNVPYEKSGTAEDNNIISKLKSKYRN